MTKILTIIRPGHQAEVFKQGYTYKVIINGIEYKAETLKMALTAAR